MLDEDVGGDFETNYFWTIILRTMRLSAKTLRQ